MNPRTRLAAAACLLALGAPATTTKKAAAAEEPVAVTFAYAPGAGAPAPARVCVSGEFNDWAPDAWPLARGRDGVFRRDVRLAPGVYRYKLVVDGAWTHDPANPRREPDGHRNSVLVVGDVPPPDLSDRGPSRGSVPRPTRARLDAFHVVAADDLGAAEGLAARPVFVYTPPSYASRPARRFPTLYAHDGQNVWSEDGICFGHGGWYLEATLDRLVAERAIEEVILVAIPHGEDRLREYGQPAAYGRFLVDVVKPAIDARFRTDPARTSLIGSSMGGLVSFTLALRRGDVFQQAACLSPSFWFEDPAAPEKTAFDLLRARGKQPVRLYLDSGTAGPSQDGAPNTRRMRDALVARGWRVGDDLLHHEAEGAEHNERAWRERVDRPLRWLFGPR